MPVIQQGSVNVSSLQVPNVYVQILQPQSVVVGGIASNILGIVGSASWGPVNSPVTISNMSDFNFYFGSVRTEKYDLGTSVSIATLQSASNMRCVRVTDGSDVKAKIDVLDSGHAPFFYNLLCSVDTGFTFNATNTEFASARLQQIDQGGGTYLGDVITPPNPLIGQVDIYSSFIAVDDGTIRYTLDGKWWNGTAWVVSSNVWAESNTAVEINSNISSLVPTGTNIAVKIITNDGTTQQWVSNVVVEYVSLANPIGNVAMTLTAMYSGSVGNEINAVIAEGSNSTISNPTFKISILRPNYPVEIFDNIGGVGAALYQNMVNAINLGQSSVRSKSQFVVASLPTVESILPPTLSTYVLAGGLNGNTSITSSTLLGVDGVSRTGLYTLRGSLCSIAFLSGNYDTTTWSAEMAYGLSEGTYMIMCGPSGQYAGIDAAIAAKKAAGIDSYDSKVLLGDWCYFNDVVNGQSRLVPPTAYVAGRLSNLSPEYSALNVEIFGIVGTEATYNNKIYSDADILKLIDAGIDLVSIQSPGGSYFSCRIGHNSSSNISIRGDNYTRLTNYIAYSLNAAMGVFIGRLETPAEQSKAAAAINSFLYNMQSKGMIDSFSVVLDSTNNPESQVAKGMMQADVRVKYFAVIEVFLINVEGSQSTVTIQQAQPVV